MLDGNIDMKILKVDKDKVQKLGISTDQLFKACQRFARTGYSIKKGRWVFEDSKH